MWRKMRLAEPRVLALLLPVSWVREELAPAHPPVLAPLPRRIALQKVMMLLIAAACRL